MTRLVCIGDCHFGPQGGRNADRYHALDQIIAHGRGLEEFGGWLMAGDLFHARSTVEDRNALAERLQTMAGIGPIVLVQGNHDQIGDLDIFTRLAAPWPIYVATAPQVLHIRLATRERAAIWTLPYVHRAGLVNAGSAHANLGADARAALEPIFMAASAELQEATAAGELAVMLGHIAVGGAVLSTGQPSIGAEIELDPALLARLGDVPKILGHIHRHQHIHGAVYLGSIARMDFGEQEEKVFGILEYASPDAWKLKVAATDVPGQHHVDGDLSRERFMITAIDGKPLDPDGAVHFDWRGSDVRCRYTFVQAEIGALDVAKVHAEFAGCRSLKLDGVPQLEHQVRAPEIAAAATLEDKAQAYARLVGLPWTDGLGAKLTALQTQESAAVLSLLSQSLALAGAQPGDVARPAEQAVA